MTTTPHMKIIHDKEPIRLFKSDLLEFFTHIHPAVVLAIWLPVVFYFLITAITQQATPGATSWLLLVLAYVAGLFLWTFAEYTLHRFVFHFRPRAAWQERLAFLFHGVHHAQPKCKTRLVMPPVVSIPLAALFYGAFYLIFGQLLGTAQWIAPAFAGFLSGYLIYDMTHYATHHASMRRGVFKFLKRHHMQHHYKTPDQRYGVSSPLWDTLFGTLPRGE
jgi:sterol desaturase/sphingolipid hydroxylase (fatty acid hydroxylase superfamily)